MMRPDADPTVNQYLAMWRNCAIFGLAGPEAERLAFGLTISERLASGLIASEFRPVACENVYPPLLRSHAQAPTFCWITARPKHERYYKCGGLQSRRLPERLI